jgi:serine phosphatase RsbU (regulator of sigma subunit)
VFPESTYDQGELAIAAGDRMIFYTDGITEARNRDGDEYGEEKLAEAALSCRTESAEAIKERLLADVNTFTGGQFDDDATLIVVGIP